MNKASQYCGQQQNILGIFSCARDKCACSLCKAREEDWEDVCQKQVQPSQILLASFTPGWLSTVLPFCLHSTFILPLILLSVRKKMFLHYYCYILGITSKKPWAGFVKAQWNSKEKHKSEISVSFGLRINLTWSIQVASFCIHWIHGSLR